MASEALGCSGGSVDLLDLASCACACLFCSAGLGSGKEGGRAGKFEEVTFAGKPVVFVIEWIWMSLVGNLMNVTLLNHSPNSISRGPHSASACGSPGHPRASSTPARARPQSSSIPLAVLATLLRCDIRRPHRWTAASNLGHRSRH